MLMTVAGLAKTSLYVPASLEAVIYLLASILYLSIFLATIADLDKRTEQSPATHSARAWVVVPSPSKISSKWS